MTSREFFELLQKSVFNRLTGTVMLYRQFFQDHQFQQLMTDAPTAGVLLILKRVLAEAIVVSTCRLLDPATGGPNKRKNLSLKALAGHLRAEGEAKGAKMIEDWFSQNQDTVQRIKTLRDRFVGHLDVQDYVSETFKTYTHEEVLALFDSLDELVGEISRRLRGSWSSHDEIGMPTGNGTAFLHVAQLGNAYRDLLSAVFNGAAPQQMLERLLRDNCYEDAADQIHSGDFRDFQSWKPCIRQASLSDSPTSRSRPPSDAK